MGKIDAVTSGGGGKVPAASALAPARLPLRRGPGGTRIPPPRWQSGPCERGWCQPVSKMAAGPRLGRGRSWGHLGGAGRNPRRSPPCSWPELQQQQQNPVPASSALRNCPILTELHLFIFSPEPRIAAPSMAACGMVVLHSRWLVASVSPGYVTQRCTKAGFLGKENPLRGCLFQA